MHFPAHAFTILSCGHYEGLWTARGQGPGPSEWYGPSGRREPYHSGGPGLGPRAVYKHSYRAQAKDSIAFSALNGCSIITQFWMAALENSVGYWYIILCFSCTFSQRALKRGRDRSLLDDSARSCYYRRIETYTWCVSNQWTSVLHLQSPR